MPSAEATPPCKQPPTPQPPPPPPCAASPSVAHTYASSARNKTLCALPTQARAPDDIPPLSSLRVCEAPRNGGKRTEEFFRLTDEARSSLLECHCKVRGVYVPFRAPTSTSTHVRRATPRRLHLHPHLRTRIRFVLIYVDERRGVPISTAFNLCPAKCAHAFRGTRGMFMRGVGAINCSSFARFCATSPNTLSYQTREFHAFVLP